MVNRYQQNNILDQAHKPHRLKKQEVVNRMRRTEEAKQMGKLRVIIKRPDEKYGHVTHISPTLENLQKTVGGQLEEIPLQKSNVTDSQVVLCNEEGKLKGLPRNFIIGYEGILIDAIAGTVIVAQFNKDGEQVDLDMKFSTWKQLLEDWGN